MDKRPTVFIGSSTEGLPVANFLKDQFSEKAIVKIWNQHGIFTRGVNYLESLLNASTLHDFAIIIFTGDDEVSIRNEKHATARDNVLFEFGLFLGRLGKRRAYAFVQDKLRLPTDMAGIHFDHFGLNSEQQPNEFFATTAAKLVADILEHHTTTAEFSLLPSTALAIGYFENFISRICDQLDDYEPVIIREQIVKYSTFTLNIVIVDDLRLIEHGNLRNILRGLELVTVKNSKFRDYPFYVDAVPHAGATHLELFDIPTTMKSSRRAVEKIFPSEFVGKNILQNLAAQREAANFEHTLRLLLEERPIWKRNIKYRYLSEFVRNDNI